MQRERILTGLRANSEFHIGNYLGAILPMVELQRRYAGEYDINMFVPDLHSFTTPIDHSKLYRQTIDNLKLFVATGLDIHNQHTFIYRQSFVPAHSELAWILDCFTGFGELERMTQFKDKQAQMTAEMAERVSAGELAVGSSSEEKHRVTAGLFNYPVLMAADILLYGAKYVPVGDDQRQHLELTRDLAMRLNNKFEQELFTVPVDWNEQLKFAQRDSGIRIRSLRNPEKKMSKSVSDPSGTIMMSDNPAEAAKKVMRAETDSFGEIKFDLAERPGVSNLLQMLALLSGRLQKEVNAEWEGKTSYGDLKKKAAAEVEKFLSGLQENLTKVDEAALIAKLEHDEAAMRDIAGKTLLRVQQVVGLRPR
jgi:tryptophanyl-tRNA synthetase